MNEPATTPTASHAPVNILLVDDQPGKLLSYEVILAELGENLLKASSAQEALELLLRNEVAVILVDVCMPDLDGFGLAKLIREHPRFQETAMIFISAIHLSELDSLRGYEMGAVDYVPVPVVPGVLRAKVRVFVDLYRKTRELARLNNELEQRVAQRTAELEVAIEHQELLAREVDHRARNALAVIQAIVSMTPATSSAEFARAIDGRIRAMARAHTLLSRSRWQGADLLRLITEELEPYHGEERVNLDGAAVVIKPTVAQNLALVLHELATNAAKYGALSTARGKLNISWSLGPDHLVLHWREQCRRDIDAPSSSGFGAKVIRSSIKALEGKIDNEWTKTGLHCTLHLPIIHFGAPAKGTGAVEDESGRDTFGAEAAEYPLAGCRIVVVEDEPLVAMMVAKMLADLGAQALGPFGSLAEAFAALPLDFDAAVLDVNVGGELVYPLAAELARSGAPVVFLTGYESDSIDERFAEAPILTKPIERGDLIEALNTLSPHRKGASSTSVAG
jgi:two-component sensor histidine kinase